MVNLNITVSHRKIPFKEASKMTTPSFLAAGNTDCRSTYSLVKIFKQ
ncbi:14448_t:CDS:2 [Funneliformis geosporum]|uniref:14448_t:CDS:1 n=1 Tax=Funneliformis geosporum TaxID=1117311 RepID=A0A9W4WY47_9GLOM|nr:14448_t:CDS:2 [Funneliformis geosporum]